ncbi:LytR/AlgR family response regulator transcription factor [Ekhidna sp. To15]|uniref:LytR/AlgR family response regulator transcription factor n=1 Tax=Ekhidna sp. To15 TaxID=3395267 RepID=UPI003F5267A6
MMNPWLSIRLFKNRILSFALLIISALLVLALTQDWLHAKVQGYNFYLSESLLFNSFWLCFIPIVWLVKQLRIKSGMLSVAIKSITSATLHFLLYPALVFILSNLLFDHTFFFSRVLKYGLAEYLYIVLIGYPLIYVALSFVNQLSPSKLSPLEMITVTKGTQKILVDPKDIISIQAESPYIKLITSKGSYLHNESLKSIHEKLHNGAFVRIHKSTIINLTMLVSYTSRLNGDYDIEMKDGSIVRMSRNYGEAFKQRLNHSGQTIKSSG